MRKDYAEIRHVRRERTLAWIYISCSKDCGTFSPKETCKNMAFAFARSLKAMPGDSVLLTFNDKTWMIRALLDYDERLARHVRKIEWTVWQLVKHDGNDGPVAV
jgi:hypothetical protein